MLTIFSSLFSFGIKRHWSGEYDFKMAEWCYFKFWLFDVFKQVYICHHSLYFLRLFSDQVFFQTLLFVIFPSLADRSFNDLTQYPVFPWVIADYKSKELGWWS
jgi:hypothetical protein